MLCRYRKRIAALAIQLAREDPPLVKEVIARLRKAGEIEVDDLTYLDQIADRWTRIAQGNLSCDRRHEVVEVETPLRRTTTLKRSFPAEPAARRSAR